MRAHLLTGKTISLFNFRAVRIRLHLNPYLTRERAWAYEVARALVTCPLQAAELLLLRRLALAGGAGAGGGGALLLAGARQGAPLREAGAHGLHYVQQEAAPRPWDHLDVGDVGRHLEVGRKDEAAPGEAVGAAVVSRGGQGTSGDVPPRVWASFSGVLARK